MSACAQGRPCVEDPQRLGAALEDDQRRGNLTPENTKPPLKCGSWTGASEDQQIRAIQLNRFRLPRTSELLPLPNGARSRMPRRCGKPSSECGAGIKRRSDHGEPAKLHHPRQGESSGSGEPGKAATRR